MEKPDDGEHRELAPPFPWKRVLLIVLVILAVVGVMVLIIRAARRGGGAALASAGPAIALGITRGQLKPKSAGRPNGPTKGPMDMGFLKARLREGASQKVVLTPTELKLVLNRLFTRGNLPPPFASEQQMAKVLTTLGLRSEIRTVSGRSERRWYDLARFEKPDGSRGQDEQRGA